MPEISPEQSNILDAISQAVRGTASNFMQQTQRTGDEPKISAAEKADRVRADKASQSFKESSRLFDDSVKNNDKTQSQWKLQVEQNGKFLDNAVNAVTQQSNLGVAAFKDLESTFNLQDQLEMLQGIRDSFADGKVVEDKKWDAIHAELNRFKLTMADVGVRTKKVSKREMVGTQFKLVEHTVASLTKNQNKLNEQVTITSKKLKKASDNLDGLAKSAEEAKNISKAVMGTIAATAKFTIDETRIAMRMGVGDARDGLKDTAAMVLKLGVSTSKYMEVMADSRRVQLAMSSAGKSWKDQIIETTNELQFGRLVGSAEEGLQTAAGFVRNMSSMGVAQADMGDAISNQTSIYRDNFRALAISTDQFNALTEDMLNDVDIRKDLAKLQGTERRLYVESLQKRTAENMMMGFSIDRAKELNKHFAKISDQDPIERITDAAKARAGLGAMGMGAEGARLQELIVKLPILTGKDKIAAQEEMVKIWTKAQKVGQELVSQNLQSNVAYGKIFRNLNIQERLDTFNAEFALGMKVTQKNQTDAEATRQLADAQAAKEVHTGFQLAVRAADTYQAGLTSGATVGITIGASYLAGGLFKKGMGSIETSLGKLVTSSSAIGGGLSGGTGAMGSSLATAVAGVSAAAVAGTAAVIGVVGAVAYISSEVAKIKNLNVTEYTELAQADAIEREANKSKERKQEDKDRALEVQQQMLEVAKKQNISTDHLTKAVKDGNADRVAGNVTAEKSAVTFNVAASHRKMESIPTTGRPS